MKDTRFTTRLGGVTAPLGFYAAGVSAGIRKSGKKDLALIVTDKPSPAAAMFTTSSMAAPPVTLSRKHLEDGLLRAIVVNAGNANACTGDQGIKDAEAMAEATARAIDCKPSDVLVSSTGVIGVPMPMKVVLDGITRATKAIDKNAWLDAATAIMTTDTYEKTAAVSFLIDDTTYTVGGMAKGSGMIEPNMATMLGFLTTDAPLDSAACDAALRGSVNKTFNRITVDSDTSTNDMCVLIASGAAGGAPITKDDPRFEIVAAAIHEVCRELGRMIVRDGEGATKLITVNVSNAATDEDAVAAARSIANSPLVKTAIFGNDANWGRVAAALGKSPAKVNPNSVRIEFAGILTCDSGTAVPFSEEDAAAALAGEEVEIAVDLGLGFGAATIWTCDLSYEYVRINGSYRT